MTHMRPLLAGLLLGLLPFLALIGCGDNGGGGGRDELCASHNTNATITVAPTYSYQGTSLQYFLRGTVLFEQTDDMVTVTRTTYSNAFDRELESQPTQLNGNRLDVVLTPIPPANPDYTANVTFIFSEDGSEFCVSFDDTNGDSGTLGSYIGAALAP